jgi:uncharacterized lipoprotein NlpE involved in copper resistance
MKKTIILLFLPILFSCSTIDSEKKDKKFKGMYSYMVDAAMFTDCETNKKVSCSF